METGNKGSELCVVDRALAGKDLVKAALAAPVASHPAPMVTVKEALPRLDEFEQQEAAQRLREEKERQQMEREQQRITTD